MIARSLLDELQQLNREEKLEIIRFLTAESSENSDRFPKRARILKNWPTIAPDADAAMRRIGEEQTPKG